ncbi:hypothetical protein GCM10009730_50560 [Streptomyces albidochromogenes]
MMTPPRQRQPDQRRPATGAPGVLGAGLPVGDALTLPVGLGEGLVVAGGGDWLGRPVEGLGGGVVFAGGGAGAVVGVLEAGGSDGVGVVRGRRVAPLFRSRALRPAGRVAGRSGERAAFGGSVACRWGSSGAAFSGPGVA